MNERPPACWVLARSRSAGAPARDRAPVRLSEQQVVGEADFEGEFAHGHAARGAEVEVGVVLDVPAGGVEALVDCFSGALFGCGHSKNPYFNDAAITLLAPPAQGEQNTDRSDGRIISSVHPSDPRSPSSHQRDASWGLAGARAVRQTRQ